MSLLNVRLIATVFITAALPVLGASASVSLGASETRELNGVKFPTDHCLGDLCLKLSGMALRQKKVALFNFDVYVGGLYRSGSDHPGTDLIRMQFLRDVNSAKLKESWSESFKKYCTESCDKMDVPLEKFLALLPSVSTGQSLSYLFHPAPGRVDVSLNDEVLGSVNDAAFSKNLLGVFIGPKADPKLKSALEGSEAAK